MKGKIREYARLFGQALRGDPNINYTEGSIRRVTFLLAIPMILEMAMESVFALVDIFFVARLGPDAVATVGLTEAVISLLFAIAIGLSMATTAMVARRIGEGKPLAAAAVAAQALWIGVFTSALVGIVGWFYADRILLLMGAEEAVIEAGTTYTQIMLGGSFTILFLFLNNAIFRGAGDASIAMKSLVLANGINIILDPLLIFGWGPFPELGVTGAAVATNIGRGVGVAYQLYHLCMGSRRIRLHLREMGLQLKLALQLLRISVGGIAQFLIATASWIFLMRLVAQYGSEAIAGYTIAIRVIIFIMLPSWGLSNAVATLVGQNLGARKPDRAEATVYQVAKYNVFYMGSMALILILFPTWIMGFFSTEPGVVDSGILALRILSYGFIFLAVGIVALQAFNGAGDTMTPTWINALCFWLLQIPLAWTLATHLGMGPHGVYWAIFVADMSFSIIATLVFLRGRWKLKSV